MRFAHCPRCVWPAAFFAGALLLFISRKIMRIDVLDNAVYFYSCVQVYRHIGAQVSGLSQGPSFAGDLSIIEPFKSDAAKQQSGFFAAHL
jgi:hypothetical protein